jgi:hypothetical protein
MSEWLILLAMVIILLGLGAWIGIKIYRWLGF